MTDLVLECADGFSLTPIVNSRQCNLYLKIDQDYLENPFEFRLKSVSEKQIARMQLLYQERERRSVSRILDFRQFWQRMGNGDPEN